MINNSPAVDSSKLRSTYERWRWQIFVITWLAYAGFYLTRKSFSVAKVAISDPDGMNWSKGDLALIDFSYLTAYAAGQFLWGMCGDKFGTRVVILTGMLASVVTSVLMGASSYVAVFGVLFCIQGFCQSTGWAPLSKNIGEFFSQRERGWVMGLWCTNYAIGGFVGSALAGFAIDYFLDWRYAFYVPAAVLFVIWLMFILLQRNRPEDVGLPAIEEYHGEKEAVIDPHDKPEEELEGSWKVIGEVLTNKMVLLLGAVYFLLKPTRYLILFWSPVYVSERLGTNAMESGILGSMFELAGPLSVLFGGFVSDFVFRSKRMPISIIALVGVGTLLLFFNGLPATRWSLGLGFFAIGFLLYIPDSLISGTAAIDFGTKKGASTAAGFINGCGSIGAVIGGTLPGWIQGFIGEGENMWSYIFVGLGISLFGAALLLLPQWNTLPSTVDDPKQGTAADPGVG